MLSTRLYEVGMMPSSWHLFAYVILLTWALNSQTNIASQHSTMLVQLSTSKH